MSENQSNLESAEAVKAAAGWWANHWRCQSSRHTSSFWQSGHWEKTGCPVDEKKDDFQLALESIIREKMQKCGGSVDIDGYEMHGLLGVAAFKCGLWLGDHQIDFPSDIVGMRVEADRVSIWRKGVGRSIQTYIYPPNYIGHEERWRGEMQAEAISKLREYNGYPGTTFGALDEMMGDDPEMLSSILRTAYYDRYNNYRPWEGSNSRKRRRR